MSILVPEYLGCRPALVGYIYSNFLFWRTNWCLDISIDMYLCLLTCICWYFLCLLVCISRYLLVMWTFYSVLAIIEAGFKGCMKHIQIDQVSLPYTGANSVGHDAMFVGVEFDCHEAFYGECSINPCLNGGTCLELGHGVLCSCKGDLFTRYILLMYSLDIFY